MTQQPKFFLIAAIACLSTVAYAAPRPAPASAGFQPGGYGQGQIVTCSSDDGDRHYCNIDTRSGVQLTRQISGSPCIQNDTWGYDNRGLWVDRGCRAEFSVGSYGNQQGQGQTVTCSSDDADDSKPHYCNIDTRGGIQLTRQISGSPCIQGQTWGYDNQRVWVSRGCRAEFASGGGGNVYGQQYGGSYGGQQGQTVTCSSDDADDSKPHYCNIDTRGGIQLTRQISGSPCIQGQTWGYDNQRVWVSRGCRAEFASGGGGNVYGQGYGGSYGGQQGQIVTCSSDDGKRNWCSTSGLNLRNVTMTRQISGSVCRRNYSWGVDRSRGLWVDHGCRAEFSVGGYGGNQWRPGQGQGQIVTCSSDDGKRNWCNVDTRRGIQLTRQISGSPCIQNSTWGVDNRGLWVDNGCRAEFQVR